jgi:pimeloyl-[acyl-carrier protein] methyl ester esterase
VLCDGLTILDRTDLRVQLPRLSVPSLWIAGRRDRLVPHGAIAWAAQQATRARYLEFSGGHAPFLGHAAEIAAAIAAFHAETTAATEGVA